MFRTAAGRASHACCRRATGRLAVRVVLGSKLPLLPVVHYDAPCSSSAITTRARLLSSEATREKPHMTGLGITVTRKKGKQTGYCYGCGADLVKGSEKAGTVDTEPRRTGFWATKQEELKKSQLKNWALCARCRALSKGSKSKADIIDLGPDSRMTKVFRAEVSKIRKKPNTVVVMCVDSINVNGTFIRTIRNYVGGNPILIAITRCDLLPDYVWKSSSEEALSKVYAERTKRIMPAKVYLCSIPQDDDWEEAAATEGTRQLFEDLYEHLKGRDPYIIGAANIGKSTLTANLIDSFLETWKNTRDRLGKKRRDALQEKRVTLSALPGTTLQNVRVPCFEEHEQALWDTPGLLLDESVAHFPIRNMQRLRTQQPQKIQPVELEVDKKAFSVVFCEPGDQVPLLRFDVRLKKDESGNDSGPVRLIWNSIWKLDANVMDIAEAHENEKERARVSEEKEREEEEEDKRRLDEIDRLAGDVDMDSMPREERKALRRKMSDELVKKEIAEVGIQEVNRREKERKAQQAERQRGKQLSKLIEVHRVILDGGYGTDICLSNFGWLGVLPPSTAMIATFAPSSGVQVMDCATLALPMSWGEYKRKRPESKSEPVRKEADKAKGDDDDDDDDYSEDDEEDEDEDWQYGTSMYGDGWQHDPFGPDIDFSGYDEDYHDFGGDEHNSSNDPWEKYSGKHVGWQFDEDLRYSKMGLQEGWNPLRENELNKSEESSRKASNQEQHSSNDWSQSRQRHTDDFANSQFLPSRGRGDRTPSRQRRTNSKSASSRDDRTPSRQRRTNSKSASSRDDRTSSWQRRTNSKSASNRDDGTPSQQRRTNSKSASSRGGGHRQAAASKNDFSNKKQKRREE